MTRSIFAGVLFALCLSQGSYAQTKDKGTKQHRLLTAVPRGVGRTARNMVTFRDKQATGEEWVCLLAALADGIVSYNIERRTPLGAGAEANPILGSHPSLGRYVGTQVVLGMFEAGMTQYTHEMLDRPDSGNHWLQHLPAIVSVSVHGAAIALSEHAMRVECTQAGIVCGLPGSPKP